MAKKKDVFGGRDEQFPIHYEDGEIRIYTNPSNEVFIEDKKSGVQMRLNSHYTGKGGLQFTTNALVEPFHAHMLGWKLTPR